MTYSKNRTIDELVRAEIEKGARYRRGAKHGRLTLPDGSLVIIPSTPSDYRAPLNFRADLARRRGKR